MDKRIKIEIASDRMGCLEMDPKNKRIWRACKRQIIAHHAEGCPEMHQGWRREGTVTWLSRGTCALIQSEQTVLEVLDDLVLSTSEKRDLDQGWTVTKLVDVDTWERLFRFSNGMTSDF